MLPVADHELSTAEAFALMPEAERAALLKGMSDDELEALDSDWDFWARPKQKLPAEYVDREIEGKTLRTRWETWLILAGRGFGKTMTGAQTVRNWMCGSTPLSRGEAQYVALIAETSKDARDVMIEGPSGILAVHPAAFRPVYEPSKSRLEWPNGARAYVYNATEPNQLRGPQFDKAWCDELAKFAHLQEMWDNLQFGLRKGEHPQCLVTTTPRPLKFLRDLIADQYTVLTTGSSYENRGNLTESWFRKLQRKYEGTRLGRQELFAEIIDDNPYALWKLSDIDNARIHKDPETGKYTPALPNWQRIVVAVDPPIKSGEDADECGIIVAALGGNDEFYILEDASVQGLSPSGWSSRVVGLFHKWGADRIVAEVNQGGDMVKAVISKDDPSIPIREVHATRGKAVRAEPVSALYEQGRVHHIGALARLEDQMTDFTSDFDRKTAGYSPDRLDALVWALTELSGRSMSGRPRVRRA